ncbi:MAG: amidohydrolase family protein, partial [Burkholderiales bacterium]
ENPDLVRGVKAHAEIGGASRWGIETLKLAVEIGRGADIPVYVHLGQLWPLKDRGVVDADQLVRDIVPHLRAGDILAHPFTRHPGGFIDAKGALHPVVREAIARGVLVDVGHGSHFSFDMARKALDAGIMPYTLGADLHGLNVKVPAVAGDGRPVQAETHPFFGAAPFSLNIAMTELITLGVPLTEVVKMVTIHAAKIVRMEDRIGSLTPGYAADVSVLDLKSGRFTLRDNLRVEVIAEQLLEPAFCLRAGKRYDISSPILPRLPLAA